MRIITYVLLGIVSIALFSSADAAARPFAPSDKSAGTDLMPGVRNPVLWADVPDPSLCSDGKKFYLVSTTMHLVPGVPIMESADLVNWKTVSYVVPRFEPGDYPQADSDWGRYNLEGGRSAYGQGQWASTIRYHRGKFYVWFVCNGGRGYLYTADKAEGPWTLHSRPQYMHDGGFFFDDDGKAYVFHGSGHLSHLKDGDRVGLAAFQGDSGVLAVEKKGSKKRLVMSFDKSVFGPGRTVVRMDREIKASVPFAGDTVWLRVRADFRPGADFAEFDWSSDGQNWTPIGTRVPVRFDHTRFFMGTKFGLFAYATKALGGWVDIDSFDVTTEDHAG